VRLVIDTDTHNEIDDQFALTWALLSQDVFNIEGVYAAPYSFKHLREPMLKDYEALKSSKASGEFTEWAQRLVQRGIDPYHVPFVNPDEGMELSYHEILRVFDALEEDPAGKVLRGSDGYLTSLDKPIKSPAVEHLIERALSGGEYPLYVAAIGCLSNVASAILLEPKIIEHIVVLWTSAYPSNVNLSNEPSLNLVQDKVASQFIFDCGVPHVYLPGYHVGAQLSISLPEMEASVRGKGKIGDYLYHLYTHNPVQAMRGIDDLEERTWIIWDLINFAWLLNPNWVPSQLVRSPVLTDDFYWKHIPERHLMREAYDINRDAIFRDFFHKLEKSPK
jgi:inosine-uridine nucleoside N-ribohydrolase